MYSVNRIDIIGYQTQPVEVRQTPGGASVTDLNIVVPYSFKADNGETITSKSFHTVTLWGPMADIAGQYVRPGGQLFISGRLQTDSWEDEKTNEKRSKTKIIAMDLIMLDPKDGQMEPPPGSAAITNCVNNVQIVGNVTRDPEIRTTTNGQQVLTLGVATNERWKDKATGENRERTEFHNVVVWGALAETLGKSLKKGQRVYVTGRCQTRSWETQQGQKRQTTEVIADQVSLLGVKNAEALSSIRTDSFASNNSDNEESTPVAAGDVPQAPEVNYQSDVKAEDLPF